MQLKHEGNILKHDPLWSFGSVVYEVKQLLDNAGTRTENASPRAHRAQILTRKTSYEDVYSGQSRQRFDADVYLYARKVSIQDITGAWVNLTEKAAAKPCPSKSSLEPRCRKKSNQR